MLLKLFLSIYRLQSFCKIETQALKNPAASLNSSKDKRYQIKTLNPLPFPKTRQN